MDNVKMIVPNTLVACKEEEQLIVYFVVDIKGIFSEQEDSFYFNEGIGDCTVRFLDVRIVVIRTWSVDETHPLFILVVGGIEKRDVL